MAEFTAKDVAALREKTGCGMMDCKNALKQSNGDINLAIEKLREKGLAAATKKAGRIASEGVAFACTNEQGNVGVVVEVNSETDFVGENKDFRSFVNVIANTIIEQNPNDVEQLMKSKAFESDKTIENLVQDKILTIGENIKIRRFKRFEGIISTYIHAGGRIGVMVKFDVDKSVALSDGFKEYAKNIAMQIAAVNPLYLDDKSVPQETIDYEMKIMKEQMLNEGKPENIVDKIVLGKMNKYYKENCLIEQAYVKDGDLSVKQYTNNCSKELGSKIEIVEYVRFEKGEGLEKKEDNFADEVADMIK